MAQAKVVPWLYDLVLWSLSMLIDLFFREVKTRGSYRVPRRSAVIFVAAPHANQFVDPLLLMRQLRLEAGRRISFLIAEKSMRRKFIGTVAAAMGGISVSRAQDLQAKGTGVVFLEDRMAPLCLSGRGTKFLTATKPGSLIVLPGETTGSAEIASIESDTQLTLKREFKGLKALECLTSDTGTAYNVAPKVDQSAVYNEVFQRLDEGGCVGIFPEGGSHDRTALLPLKAGVAIMALGAMVRNPGCDLKIVPCGMNYFHAHKFRSRAVIEFGKPLEIPDRLVKLYAENETKRDATRELLDLIYDALASVTVQVPDYETLMVIQAGRRLYKPAHKKLPLQSVVELNRRFITGYNHFKDDPRVKDIKADVMKYNRDLSLMGVKDHQLTNLKLSSSQVLGLLIYRSLKLALLALGSLPGVVLFLPIFYMSKVISVRRAKEAKAGSSVKIEARDVIATWKLLVAMVLSPLLYIFYSFTGSYLVDFLIDYFQCGPGLLRRYQGSWWISAGLLILVPMITYSALRFGEIGVDIYKSLKPLRIAVVNSDILDNLRDRREIIAEKLTGLINELGPEIFQDFDSSRVVAMPEYMVEVASTRPRSNSNLSDQKGFDTPSLTSLSPNSSGALSPNTDHSAQLSNPFISTAPVSRRSYSRSHSRQPSHSGGITAVQMSGLKSDDGGTDLGLVSEKIKAELNSRMLRRRSEHLQRSRSKLSGPGSNVCVKDVEPDDQLDKSKIL
ncbi:Uncharacterized acyltransferase C1718.04 [Taphrina deformans PYCC 5710]|uniref:Uncharacterized acyltransferase C1718.04 n=1 Tax=Taphrina deformans (strain PYCC 5710 / ATCC 11124 / CBS 356.35 / IMI 108563 / JCM 9778 / NBRC 8474) TaxID=1097556 RepID=R4XC91_TAPDE|nr:Uncharacterized acyltransferase C1718.04 [Taphrina deformans PYCC 5710]|eukprot:CCG83441.1 Uncharacterized acyltransferase C1718.04 [Taphrina deformans PYCC 5710]